MFNFKFPFTHILQTSSNSFISIILLSEHFFSIAEKPFASKEMLKYKLKPPEKLICSPALSSRLLSKDNSSSRIFSFSNSVSQLYKLIKIYSESSISVSCIKMQPFLSVNRFLTFFFSIMVFFRGHWRLTGQQGKGGDLLLFDSTTPTRSRTFRHLFATLHVRWLSRIFNHNACIYQTATRWDVPPYRILIWLIDDVKLSFCLFT